MYVECSNSNPSNQGTKETNHENCATAGIPLRGPNEASVVFRIQNTAKIIALALDTNPKVSLCYVLPFTKLGAPFLQAL